MESLWKNRTFRVIFLSDMLQQTAIWVRNMALLLYVMNRTGGDPFAVSLLSLLEYAPIFVFSLIGGVLADRWNPKRTMIAGDLLSALSVCVIMILLAADWWVSLYGAVFVSAVASQFSQPSSAKVFKRHVPEDKVPAAIGFSQSVSALFLIAGPIAGTAIYQLAGIQASLLMLPILFGLSALVLAMLPQDKEAARHESKASIKDDLVSGYRFLAAQPQLRRLFLTFAIVGFAAGLVQPLEIFIVTERLGLAEEQIQWFAAVDGFGLLAGGAIAAIFSGRMKSKILLPAAMLFLGITFAVQALSLWPLVTGGFQFVNGVLLAIVNTAVGSYVISSIPERMVGKVNGLITPLFMGAMLVGTSLSGVMTHTAGLVAAFLTAAAVCAIAALNARTVDLRQTEQNGNNRVASRTKPICSK